MALTADRLTQEYGDGIPRRFQLAVNNASKIYKGALVALDADGYAKPGETATGLIAMGVSQQLADNTSGADGDISCLVMSGVFKFANSAGGDEITITHIGEVCWIVDDQTVARTDATNTRSPAGLVIGVDTDGVRVLVSPFVSRELIDAEAGLIVASMLSLADAADVTAGTGGNLIGYDDSGNKTTAATVADALDQLYIQHTSVQKQVNITLTGFVDADGDPLAKFVNGASTVPGWNIADGEAFGLRWNNHATPDPVLGSVMLPQDADDTANCVLHILASKTGATLGDAVTFTVTAFGNVAGSLHDAGADLGGATSAMTGDATAKTCQEVTLALNIPAGVCNLSLTVQPTDGLLGTDDVIIEAMWLEYKGKLLAS